MTRGLFLAVLLAPSLGHAADRDEAHDVFEALRVPEQIAIMVEEGAARGDELALTLFGPDVQPIGWDRRVAAVYDPATMEAIAFEAFAESLADVDVGPMLAWLEADPGAKLVEMELVAREAMLDPATERAARGAVYDARARASDRLALIEAHVAAGGLVERNTIAGLNANLAFERAFLAAGGREDGSSETDVVADVAAGEPLVRSAARDWADAFLLRAYAPATDEEIAAATAYLASAPGQSMTDAVFAAFDEVFADLSRRLGEAAATAVRSDEA